MSEKTGSARPLDDELLRAMKRDLPALEAMLQQASGHWGYEDPVYRFYHPQTQDGVLGRLALVPARGAILRAWPPSPSSPLAPLLCAPTPMA